MAKQKKSRKNKQYLPKKEVKRPTNEMLPPGHRFDREIADICSMILLRVQIRKLDKPTSVERELRKELKLIIAKRNISRVTMNFFESIIDLCEKNPFVRGTTRILNATYKEYVVVEAHMAKLTHLSMRQRILNLIDDIKAREWRVEFLQAKEQPISISSNNFLAIHEEWEKKCDDTGRLLETMSIGVKTKESDFFIEQAYQRGILLHKVDSKIDYYHFKVHPENNVPGIPLSPPSIQI